MRLSKPYPPRRASWPEGRSQGFPKGIPSELTRFPITFRSLVSRMTITTKGGASSPFKLILWQCTRTTNGGDCPMDTRNARAVSGWEKYPTKKAVRYRTGRMTGKPESAGLNRHVVGDARALQERRQRLHPDLESCGTHREVS